MCLRAVARMIRDGGVAVGLLVVPDLMASGRLSVKHKAVRFKAFDDLSISKT